MQKSSEKYKENRREKKTNTEIQNPWLYLGHSPDRLQGSGAHTSSKALGRGQGSWKHRKETLLLDMRNELI